MDATTLAAQATSVWSLVAGLAACGQDNATLGNARELASCIAECIRGNLSCSWGLFLLHNIEGPATIISWGLDDDQQQHLLNRNGHQPTLAAIELQLQYHHSPAGRLLLGDIPRIEATTLPGFLEGLRSQLELLIALHRREVERQSEHAQLNAASLMSLDLVGQLDLREVLHSIIERAVILSGAQIAMIYMRTEEGDLELMASHNLSDQISRVRLRDGEGLAGQIALEQTIIVVEDYQHYTHRLSTIVTDTWHSAIGVPLLAQDELSGVLVLVRTISNVPFNTHDRHLVEAFAKPVALVLRNAQLFAQQQQRSRELFVLYENGQVINATLQIEQTLTRVAENITLAMDADRCTLHLIDQNDPTRLYEVASYNVDGGGTTAGPSYAISDYNLIAELLQSGETLILETTPQENHGVAAREVLHFLGYHSALLVALKIRDQAVGLLVVGHLNHDHHFCPVEVNLAQTLANQITTAVVNARLYEAQQRRANELEKLQAISERFGAELNLDETLDALLDSVGSLVSFDGAQVCLYDSESQVLWSAVTRGIYTDYLTPALRYLLSDGLTGWVARYRRPLRLPDFSQTPVRPIVTKLTAGVPVRSYLGLPLQVGEQFTGTIELYSNRPHGFSAVDERLLMIAAGSAARAIINAQRYEQADEHLRSRIQQLTALQRISRQLTATLSLDSILSFALKEALRATRANQGYIALRAGGKDDLQVRDAETGKLMGYVALQDTSEKRPFQVIAVAGYQDEDKNRLMGQPLRDDTLVAIEALSHGEPALVDELIKDDRLREIGPKVASVLAMPIFYEDQIVGVINLHSQTPQAFNHEALEFVRALTDQAAVALGNAQRYQNQVRQRELLQQRASVLNEVLSIGQVLRADQSLEEVLEQIAFGITEVTSYRVVTFHLVDPDDPEMLQTVTGAGLPLADLERLRGHKWPFKLAQRFLDMRFQIGRSFFVPTEAMQEITSGLDLSDPTSSTPADETPSHDWQIDDGLFIPLYSTGAQILGLMSVDDPT